MLKHSKSIEYIRNGVPTVFTVDYDVYYYNGEMSALFYIADNHYNIRIYKNSWTINGEDNDAFEDISSAFMEGKHKIFELMGKLCEQIWEENQHLVIEENDDVEEES